MANNPISIVTKEELLKIQGETAINRTSKVNKVSPNSVLAALLEGNATVAAKAMKDMALATSQLFPSLAVGDALDRAARDYGISPRQGATQSSVVVKLIANPGTVYTAATTQIQGNNGVVYELESDVTVDGSGIAYPKCQSQDAGAFTAVEAYTINAISPVPAGHIAITNEYGSQGGHDEEPDDLFRNRILKGANIAAVGTLEKYTQVFRTINPDVLRTLYYGRSTSGVGFNGKLRLAVVSQNGKDFSQGEFAAMLQGAEQYLSLNEMNAAGTGSYGLKLENVEYEYVDIDMRVQLFGDADVLSVLRSLQTKFSKTVDFRFWRPGVDKIEWEDLLSIVKAEKGIKYVSDRHFVPQIDKNIPTGKLPRFRSFIIRDLNGNILQDATGIIAPIFYPGQTLAGFTETVLQ